MIKEGNKMITTAESVQNQDMGNTVQPNIIRRVNAAGVRLRRRLSNIFHCDSIDNGFF